MEPLPTIEGPKLHSFFSDILDSSRIQWIKIVGEGYDSIVWDIVIRGKHYALKLFRPTYWDREDFEEHRETTKIQQTEPFYCECRVYGRLKETGNEDLAVKAHGCVDFNSPLQYSDSDDDPESSSSSTDNQEFQRRYDPTELRENDDVRPVRGIIKELVENKPCFTPSMVPQMMKDVEYLYQLGIYIGGDIRDDAYLNGKLVDFSRAWTVSHCRLDGEDAQLDGTTGFEDFESFDRMIDDWNEENPWQRVWERFRPNLKVLNRLRSSCPEKECAVVKENATGQRILRNNTRRKYKPWRTWGKRFNLAHYDWRSALEGEAAAARKEQGSQGYCKKGSKFINRKTKAVGLKVDC